MSETRRNQNEPETKDIVLKTLRWVRICRAEGYIKDYHMHGIPTDSDASHSSLLERLLNDEEPFEEPPPLSHSYPDVGKAGEQNKPRDRRLGIHY